MNINEFSLRELRTMIPLLRGQLSNNPELVGLQKMIDEMDRFLKADSRYQKGVEIMREAKKNSGIDIGYARASDYYFAVVHADIVEESGGRKGKTITYRKTGRKYVHLILCFKWNWWMNGESYRHHLDGSPGRNFSDFMPKEPRDDFHGDEWGDDPKVLREALLKSGLEEKPELVKLYNEYIVAIRQHRADQVKRWESEDRDLD